MDLNRLDLFASANHGLITRQAAGRAGISKATWFRWHATGRLAGLYPRVARLPGSPETREQRIAAAVLAAQPGAMASHRSAAYLWGVPRPDDDPLDVMLVSRTRGLALDGVNLHRPRDDKDLSPVLRSRIRTSNILRFLCDLGAVDSVGVREAVLYVVTSGLASPRALRTAIDVHTRRGCHGVPAFREALAEFVLDDKPVDSVLESTMNEVATRFGLPPMRFHAIVCGYEVDFLIIDTPIVLECDGWDTHGRQRAQFERDRERDPTITAAGYIVIRFTWRRLTRDPQWVVHKIRENLARWGHLNPVADSLGIETVRNQIEQ